MASYEEWNQAILEFYRHSVQRGTLGYLNIDDGSFRLIGRQLILFETDARKDFLLAVRSHCVRNGSIHTGELHGRDLEGHVRCAAFLAALVLASSRMGEDEKNNSNAYFSRLREVLGLPPAGKGAARPKGLKGADERSLWEDWNNWNVEHHLIPTARRGRSNQDKYRGYAIGQSLLRDADKQSLRNAFSRFKFGLLYDGDEVLHRLRKNKGHLTAHLRDLLSDGRAEAAADYIFEIYEEWNKTLIERAYETVEKGQSSRNQNQCYLPNDSKTLFCGLLRREHPFSGVVTYYLLPRFRPHHGIKTGELYLRDQWRSLLPHDVRWWKSVGPIDERMIASGHHFQVRGDGLQPYIYSQATLPARDFWVLVPDDLYGSDDFASWRAPKLGEPFVLLVKKHLYPYLLPLRGVVIDWDSLPEPLDNAPDWIEVWGIRVVATDWSGMTLPDIALLDALKPRHHLALSLSGGIRGPQRSGLWLAGYSPQLTVHTVISQRNEDARVELVSPTSKTMSFSVTPNESTPLPLDEVGVWLVQVIYGGEEAATLVEIADWDGEPMARPLVDVWGHAGDLRWFGALLEDELACSLAE